MVRAYELAHLLLRQSIKPGDRVVDATVGNGFDTFFLADLVGPGGHVIGFDVQEDAIRAARRRVDGMAQVTLVHCGHERLEEHLPVGWRNQLSAVMFNLGYLPGGDKNVVTRASTTVSALEQSIDNIVTGGLITLVVYPGHCGGTNEASAVLSFAEQLPAAFSCARYGRINALKPAPELIVISRVR